MAERTNLNVTVGVWPGTVVNDEEKKALEKVLSEVAGIDMSVAELDEVKLDEVGLVITEDIQEDVKTNSNKLFQLLSEYLVTVGDLRPEYREGLAIAARYIREHSNYSWVGHFEKIIDLEGNFVRWANTY